MQKFRGKANLFCRHYMDSAISVLMITPKGRLGRGGIDRLVWSICDRIGKAEHGVEIYPIVSRGPGSIALSPFYTIHALLMLIRLRLQGKADVVHINLASGASAIRKTMIARVARLLKIRTLIHLHGGNFIRYWETRSYLQSKNIESMFMHADGVIVLGAIWRELLIGRVPAIEKRIFVLPNAVSSVDYASTSRQAYAHSAHKPLRILFLGDISEDKGVPSLVEALNSIRNIGDWHATFAGAGEIERVGRLIESYKLEERIALTGWVGGKDVDSLLRRADIFALPSRIENLPMSIIEAMAHGLAIVATPVGAVGEIIEDDRTGLLVSADDVEGLSQALKRLVTDGQLRERLGRSAIEYQRTRLDMDRVYVPELVRIWKCVATLHS